jgi:DNA-binding transcriptional LysR family regulator
MPPVGALRQITNQVVVAVRPKYPGVDIRVTVVPEAVVAPDRVIIDVVIRERPKQRPDPAIEAVAVPPPPVCDVAAMPSGQRRSRGELPARSRVA